ILPNDK
uniref:Cryptide Pep-13 n=2 Tax=Tityus TaxID=6886 RepID=CRY13_TITOB